MLVKTIILSLFLCSSAYSQPKEMAGFERSEIDRLNKKIEALLENSQCSLNSHVNIINVFNVRYEGEILKSDFAKRTFLNKIKPVYFFQNSIFKEKKYLQSHAYICDQSGKLIAESDGRSIYCLKVYNKNAYNSQKQLVNYAFYYQFSFVFYVELTPLATYFAIDKSKNIYVLVGNAEGCDCYLLDDFLKNFSEDFFKP